MTDHIQPQIAAQLHRYWPLPDDVEVARQRAHERRLMAHPDPRDPEHPEMVEVDE